MDVADWDEIPEDLKITPERLEQLVAEGAPEWFARYPAALERAGERRCRAAVRGLGGLYWPCARPAAPEKRYCFGHRALQDS